MRICTSFTLLQSSSPAVPLYVCPWGFQERICKKPQTDNIFWIWERIDTDTSDVPVQRISCVDFKAFKENNFQSIRAKFRTHKQ